MPTALVMPWPSGPVVVSTPGVMPNSGWPGVLLCSWRKLLQLARSAGRSRSGAAARRAASSRGRWTARSGRGRTTAGWPGCGAGAGSTAPPRSRPCPSARRGGRSWPAAPRPSRGRGSRWPSGAIARSPSSGARAPALRDRAVRGNDRGHLREVRAAGEPAILRAGARRDPAAIIAPMRGLHLTADLRGCAAGAAGDDRRRRRCASTCLAAVAARRASRRSASCSIASCRGARTARRAGGDHRRRPARRIAPRGPHLAGARGGDARRLRLQPRRRQLGTRRSRCWRR